MNSLQKVCYHRPRVLIAQYGGFHAEPMALGLRERRIPGVFLTTHFSRSLWGFLGLGPVKVEKFTRSNFARLFQQASKISRVPALRRLAPQLSEKTRESFDRRCAKTIKPSMSIFHAYSSGLPLSLQKARDAGARTFVDFGLLHPRMINEKLMPEYAALGLNFNPIDVKRTDHELALAERVLVPSLSVKNSFLREGYQAEKLQIVPYGVDPFWFAHRSPVKKKSRETLNIAFAGGLSVRKGIHLLAGVSHYLSAVGVPHRFFLFGSWEPGVEQKVTFPPGAVAHAGAASKVTLRNSYQHMDVFVLPSLAEGMARAVLEAMACGLPVVTSPNSGYAEIIEHRTSGFIANPQNFEEMGLVIRELFDNPGLADSIGENALRVAKRYTWERYVNATLEAYGPDSVPN